MIETRNADLQKAKKIIKTFDSTINGDMGMNMSCPEFSVDLSAYFDGELESEEIITIETHLKTCDGCQASLAQFNAIRKAMKTRLAEGLKGRKPIFEAIREQLEAEQEESDDSDPALIS